MDASCCACRAVIREQYVQASQANTAELERQLGVQSAELEHAQRQVQALSAQCAEILSQLQETGAWIPSRIPRSPSDGHYQTPKLNRMRVWFAMLIT